MVSSRFGSSVPPRWLEAMKRRSGVSARAVVAISSRQSPPRRSSPSTTADEGLAPGYSRPTGSIRPSVAGRVVVDAQEADAARRVRLEQGTDLAVLLVALALPPAVEAEGDAGQGHPEPRKPGAPAPPTRIHEAYRSER